jgi:DNA repair exonuclease SbcCD ATPase subunit
MKGSNLEDLEPIQPQATSQLGYNVTNSTEVAGVDKIRDLLFGNQMQDYDRRFSMLEERFLQRFREIESETARNIGFLESSAKKQMESFAAELREEKDLRIDADKEIERIERDHNDTIEKRLRSTSEQLTRLEREQAERLTQEVQSLRDELKRRNEDIQHMIEKMFAELSSVKTDRNLLAGLFLEVARCLNQDVGPNRGGRGAIEPPRSWGPT